MEEEQASVLREYLLKEVEILQDIIKRMAFNSFLIKGWTVTLVVVSLLVKSGQQHVHLAFIPLLVFWFLDAYFLWQERMYRKLYEWVIAHRLQTSEHLLDLNAYRFRSEVQSIPRIMVSITLFWFYATLAVLVAAFLFIQLKMF